MYYLSLKEKIKFINLTNISIFLSSLFFIFFIYLSIPSLYNFDKLKPELEEKINEELGINLKFKKKIKYVFFPSPRLKLQDVEIYNFNQINEIISNKNEINIILKIFSLYNSKNLKFKKLKINNATFNIRYPIIKDFNNFFSNKLSIYPIEIVNSKIIFKEKEEFIFNVNLLSLKLFFYQNLNKFIFNVEVFNSKLNGMYNKSLDKKKSYFAISFPMLGINLKSYIDPKYSESNFTGKTIIRYPKTKIDLKHKKIEDEFIISSSKIRSPIFDSNFTGTINFEPFNFYIDFNAVKLDFYKLITSNIFNFTKISNLFPVNKKINGSLTFNIKDFKTKLKKINTARALLEFKNGVLDIKDFNLFLDNIVNINLDGSIYMKKERKFFDFKSRIKVINNQKFYSKLLVPKKRRKSKIDISLEGKLNMDNNKLFIDYFSNNKNQLNEQKLKFLNSEINSYVSKKSYEEIFNIFNFRLFIAKFL